MAKITRREFLKQTAKGAAATVTGLATIDKLLSPEQAQAAPAANGASNAKNAGSVISLPKGGGAVKGIGETFKPNPFTGTANFSVPIATSPGRAGFGPELSLQYSSGNGNGPFGLGWDLSVPMVSRKTEKGIPRYTDDDIFVLSGAEDLVPRTEDETPWKPETVGNYRVTTYRPRTEGLFAMIERWERISGPAEPTLNDIFWKITTKDNITSIYGLSITASLRNPTIDRNPAQGVFQWHLELTYDDKGNYIRYGYKNDTVTDLANRPSEAHRSKGIIYQNYLKNIHYGNLDPFFPTGIEDIIAHLKADPNGASHFFLALFDYGEHGAKEKCNGCVSELYDHIITTNIHEEKDENGSSQNWNIRPDPFSNYRAGFEIRTYRRCQRVLMFHYMPGDTTPTLVRSTDFQYDQLPYSLYSTLINVAERGYRKLETPRAASNPVESEEIALRGPDQKLSGAKSRYYWVKSIPALEFEYSKFEPKKQKFKPFTAKDKDMPPASLKNPNFSLIDITKTGLPDVLQTTPYGYYYWQNLGNGVFDRRRELKNRPAGVTLDQPGVGFGDMAGDGTADLLVHAGSQWGFYESDSNGGWKRPHFYKVFPSFSLGDPNVRLTDLTGDGKSDILRTDDGSFTWFPCLGEDGFDEPHYIRRKYDLEEFPDVFFSDPRVQLADMTGDGLNDIVLIHSGRIDYWPNLGYGKFGKRVTMENTPRFGYDFDPRRLFLMDVDGSGPVDMVYVEVGKVRFWFNQSGNSWSEEQVIQGTPFITDQDSLQLADMSGSGGSGILWSGDYRANGRPHYMYLDFTGGVKPNVLVEMDNNMGKTTRAQYKPSTYFYLKDREKNPYHPWVTTLPFPVQCLERVEVIDHISRTKLVTRYAYHHGYYDGREREFRGFAFVEQWDSESFEDFSHKTSPDDFDFLNSNQAYHVPPVYTKTWFHTGAFPADLEDDFRKNRRGNGRRSIDIRNVFSRDYYQGDREAPALPPSTIIEDPAFYHLQSLREAYRALRGQVLRQEIYADDDVPGKSEHPYTVTESNFAVKLVQPRGENPHAVLLVHPRESLSFQYERKRYPVGGRMVADPRTTHNITLAVDKYGNVLQSVSIGYGRRYEDVDPELSAEDRERQKFTAITYTENKFTNDVLERFAYRPPLPCETQTFELLNVPVQIRNPGMRPIFRFAELNQVVNALADGAHDLPYEDVMGTQAVEDHPYRRLIEHERVLYRRKELDGPHPPCELDSMALPYESYKLAFTPGLLAEIFGNRVDDQMLRDGGYYQFPGHPGWWIRSGLVYYSDNPDHNAAQELAFARQHFYLPHRFEDPFKNESKVEYDTLRLLPEKTIDPLENSILAENDYRVLQPKQMADPNGNRSAVSFDALGMVAGTAVMGKAFPAPVEGDSLEGFEADLPGEVVLDHLLADPHAILANATTRLVYDLFAYLRTGDQAEPQPAVVYTLARETHVADLQQKEHTKIQHSFSYSDGFGREVQKKIQAEPGPVPQRDAAGKIILDEDKQPEMTENDANPRWVGSGWTIFNNKGKPVEQYEPFFSNTHHFEFVVQLGVSSTLFYDPLERVVATLHPNHTYEKVVFDPWQQTTFDVNDTCAPRNQQTGDPRTDPDIAGYIARFFEAMDSDPASWQTWHAQRIGGELGEDEGTAAERAAAHADTPTTSHFDTLGRPFLTIAHNRAVCPNHALDGAEGKFHSRVKLDIEGNQREVVDANDRIVMRYDYDMLGNRIHQASMEAVERWMLNDVAGKSIRTWDSRGFLRRMTYDELQRLTGLYVTENGTERLAEYIVYGENQGDTKNHKTQIYQMFDSAGRVTNTSYDFKGNLQQSTLDLLPKYNLGVDWQQNPNPNDGTFATSTTYDALNRPLTVTTPDNSVYRPTFNKTNLLKKVEVNLRGERVNGELKWSPFVININYNAKSQRELIEYANGAQTKYDYDPFTFRLKKLKTTRPAGRNGLSQLFIDPTVVQDLHYTYDPAGNITRIEDAALKTVNNGQPVAPVNNYTYDALYRLIEAGSREHIGQTAFDFNQLNGDYRDYPFVGLRAHPNDPQALRNYTEQYEYDEVGNFRSMRHIAGGGSWTRYYDYEEDSLIEPGVKKSNRLTRTRVGNGLNFTETYTYTDAQGNDVQGCITSINNMAITWDFKDQLQQVNLGGGGMAYYVYDATGQRVRKVIESQNGTRQKERIYFSGFELYREYNSDGITVMLQRESLHIMDDKQRIALAETQTIENGSAVTTPAPLLRYQLGNHLGSASVELDRDSSLISYEEYHPYGTTTFQAGRSIAEVSLKRYRHTGKERDEESGLYYHGARYYIAGLGIWTSPDPIRPSGGNSLYVFVVRNPINFLDNTGLQEKPADNSISEKDKRILNLRDLEDTIRNMDQEHLGIGPSGFVFKQLENKFEIATNDKQFINTMKQSTDHSCLLNAVRYVVQKKYNVQIGLETGQTNREEGEVNTGDRVIWSLILKQHSSEKNFYQSFLGKEREVNTAALGHDLNNAKNWLDSFGIQSKDTELVTNLKNLFNFDSQREWKGHIFLAGKSAGVPHAYVIHEARKGEAGKIEIRAYDPWTGKNVETIHGKEKTDWLDLEQFQIDYALPLNQQGAITPEGQYSQVLVIQDQQVNLNVQPTVKNEYFKLHENLY